MNAFLTNEYQNMNSKKKHSKIAIYVDFDPSPSLGHELSPCKIEFLTRAVQEQILKISLNSSTVKEQLYLNCSKAF